MSDKPSVRPLALGGSTCGPLEGAESSERAGDELADREVDGLELDDVVLLAELLLVVDDVVEEVVAEDEVAVLGADDTVSVVDAAAEPDDSVGDEQAERTASATTAPTAVAGTREHREVLTAMTRPAPRACMSQVINVSPI
jgi:hypothetical protein